MNETQLDALKKIKEKEYFWYTNLKQEDLLVKAEDGKTILEHAIEEEANISGFNDIYQNSFEILEIFIKYNKKDVVKYLSLTEEQLFKEYEGTTLAEYLYKEDMFNGSNVFNVTSHMEIVDYILKYDQYDISSLNKKIIDKLLTRNEEGNYYLEQYMDNDYFIKSIIPKINNPRMIIELNNKYKNPNILKNINPSVATYKLSDGLTLFEYLMDKKIEVDLINNVPNNKEIIDILIKRNEINKLIDIDDNTLAETLEGSNPPTTVLDYLLDNINITKLTSTISSDEVIKILRDRGMLNKIEFEYSKPFSFKSENILDLPEDYTTLEFLIDNKVNFKMSHWSKECKVLFDKNYLQALPRLTSIKDIKKINGIDQYLDEIKQDHIKSTISSLGTYDSTIQEIAEFYITLGRKDMEMYLDRLEERDLLKNKDNQILLDEMLKIDKDITIKKFLPRLKNKTKIAAILKLHGIDVEEYNVGQINDPTKDYRNNLENAPQLGPLPEDAEIYLKELESLFKSDEKSDHSIIDLLIEGFRNGLLQYYEGTLSEVKNLIEIKKHNPDFYYIRDEENGYFSRNENAIHTNSSIDTIMHETGHALHSFIDELRTPDEYEAIKKKLRDDPATFERLLAFREKVNEIEESAKAKSNEIIETVGISQTSNIEEFLSEDKEKKREELKELLGLIDIDEETLDQILSEMYTPEQFEGHKKRIIHSEVRDQLIRSKYGVYADISDVFDSIYGGKFRGGIMEDHEGKQIKGWYGHGIAYYSKEFHGFDELVAEFSSLLKTSNSIENLAILKQFIGNELFELVSNYYYNVIIKGTYTPSKDEEEEIDITIEDSGRSR